MDVYGVVLRVQNIGKAPTSVGLLKPIGQEETLQKVTVRLDTTDTPIPNLKSQVITVDNILGSNPAYNIPLKPGARVLLNMERGPTGQWVFYITNRDRSPAIMILASLLLLGVLLIGGSEVTKHILLAILVLTGCYKALFPAVLNGSGGIAWAFLMCFMFTILGSFIYKNPEDSPKRMAFSIQQAIVISGTMGGLVILSAIMWIMHWITPLDGFSSEGLASLWYRSPHMDYWALLMASILLAFQGFIFYLCWMLSQNRKPAPGEPEEALSFSQRFHILMLRGRRLLGPMLSSLGLLFIGLCLPILLQLQGTPTMQFMNLESTASVLTIAFAGGLTLILTVPLTALIAAWLLHPAGETDIWAQLKGLVSIK
jgi:uncharacterized membrane protein